VIKLEPLGGDPFRSMIGGLGAAKCNTGKQSICLDLKRPEAQEIAAALAARADVFIHNYRPGVPERLGLGYESLAAANPGLVYLSANGYGPDGPGALRPSTHPIPGAALGGVVWQMGGLPGPGSMALDDVREVTRRLFRANEVNPDPNTSMVIATAASLGLLARALTGRGQKILVDMFGANAWANWDDFLSYPGKRERASLDPSLHGLAARYRLYECADGWVFVYAASDSALTRLGPLDSLDEVFRRRGVQEWLASLTGPEIWCVRADSGWPADFLLGSELAVQDELVVPAVHPEWGEYLRHGPMVRFGRGLEYPAAGVAGDATVPLLEELGFTGEQVARLLDEGVVRRSGS
jgi:crotonobetainyl-CoA:carnitine CoA-transferase CaiB-like acyl-CoA transferase